MDRYGFMLVAFSLMAIPVGGLNYLFGKRTKDERFVGGVLTLVGCLLWVTVWVNMEPTQPVYSPTRPVYSYSVSTSRTTESTAAAEYASSSGSSYSTSNRGYRDPWICWAKGCTRKIEGINACSRHMCMAPNCKQVVMEGTSWCVRHEINLKCNLRDCDNPSVKGTTRCKEHQIGSSQVSGTTSSPATKSGYSSPTVSFPRSHTTSDPYDVAEYDSAEDFADEWEEDFEDWDDAYEYWEDEYDE